MCIGTNNRLRGVFGMFAVDLQWTKDSVPIVMQSLLVILSRTGKELPLSQMNCSLSFIRGMHHMSTQMHQ